MNPPARAGDQQDAPVDSSAIVVAGSPTTSTSSRSTSGWRASCGRGRRGPASRPRPARSRPACPGRTGGIAGGAPPRCDCPNAGAAALGLGERERGCGVIGGGAVGGQHDRTAAGLLGGAGRDHDDRAGRVLHNPGRGRAHREVLACGEPAAPDDDRGGAAAGLDQCAHGAVGDHAVRGVDGVGELGELVPHRALDVRAGRLVERHHAADGAIGGDDLEHSVVIASPRGGPRHGTNRVSRAVVPAHHRPGRGLRRACQRSPAWRPPAGLMSEPASRRSGCPPDQRTAALSGGLHRSSPGGVRSAPPGGVRTCPRRAACGTGSRGRPADLPSRVRLAVTPERGRRRGGRKTTSKTDQFQKVAYGCVMTTAMEGPEQQLRQAGVEGHLRAAGGPRRRRCQPTHRGGGRVRHHVRERPARCPPAPSTTPYGCARTPDSCRSSRPARQPATNGGPATLTTTWSAGAVGGSRTSTARSGTPPASQRTTIRASS